MSEPTRKRSARATWDAMMRAFPSDEAERIAKLSPEEVDRELRAEGIDPEKLVLPFKDEGHEGVRRDQAPQRTRASRGVVIPFRARATWLLVAAAAIVLIGYSFRRDITALFSPGPPEIGPDQILEERRIAAARRKAAQLREDAFADCEQGVWYMCQERLDSAKALDAAGEADATVVKWRERIAKEMAPRDGGEIDPKTGRPRR